MKNKLVAIGFMVLLTVGSNVSHAESQPCGNCKIDKSKTSFDSTATAGNKVAQAVVVRAGATTGARALAGVSKNSTAFDEGKTQTAQR